MFNPFSDNPSLFSFFFKGKLKLYLQTAIWLLAKIQHTTIYLDSHYLSHNFHFVIRRTKLHQPRSWTQWHREAISSFPITLGGAGILYKKQVHIKYYVVNNPVGGKFMSVFSFEGHCPLCPLQLRAWVAFGDSFSYFCLHAMVTQIKVFWLKVPPTFGKGRSSYAVLLHDA